ncbi:MAG: sugar porter family MFS transporter [Saprospiraceae bacterium]
MNKKIFYWSITVALAGFLFGFDTIVISGADQALEALWQKGKLFHGTVIIASALWGTVIGAIFGGIPTDKIGRKNTLILIGILYVVSAIGSALANDPWIFALFRFIGGLGVGASTIAAPAYISEIAPSAYRGRLVASYQFNIVFGILVAFYSNYLLSDIGENAWRWMIGVEAIPAFIYFLMVLNVPKSPRWLVINKADEEGARKILAINYPEEIISSKIQQYKLSVKETNLPKESVFQKKWKKPLMLAFFISFFNQFSGINALLYYAPRIFEAAGLESSSSFLSSIGLGVTNLIFTLVGLSLIDKMGRKQLLYIGSAGYIISLSMVAAAFYFNWGGVVIPLFLFLFIGAHAIGQGTVIWVFIAEIFPNHLRSSGQAFGVSIHWVLAAIIPSFIPSLFESIGPAPVFLFFASMMVLQAIWVYLKVPETKGIPLEELEKQMIEG